MTGKRQCLYGLAARRITTSSQNLLNKMAEAEVKEYPKINERKKTIRRKRIKNKK